MLYEVITLDEDLQLERHLTGAYAQGLQMGQAIRNILLDPRNPKAYANYEKAEQDFNAHTAAAIRVGGTGFARLGELETLAAQWQPLRHQVIDTVRAGDVDAGRALLNSHETPAWRAAKSVITSYSIHYTKLYETSSRMSTDPETGFSHNSHSGPPTIFLFNRTRSKKN